MKRTDTTPPYLSWCLIVRNCETQLEDCLKSIRERTPQAEIVCVDTCSGDSTPEIAQRYADVFEIYRGPKGNWDENMAWFDDAAAARQRSFEIAHGTFRAWVDSDDILASPAEAERLLKLNNRWKPERKGAKIEGDATAPPATLEDTLRRLEELAPEATCVWAPYLYQRDEHDLALVWQDRERIVKWSDPPKFRWSEEAHEILVPVEGYVPPRVDFAHLLFLHQKKFTAEDYDYNLQRHYSILLKKYEAGERTNRRCLYLANQAQFLDPKRELEFLAEAHDQANTTLDRYRALCDAAAYYLRRGLYNDALENFGGATLLHPELPDAWLAMGCAAYDFRDFSRAALWLERGLSCDTSTPACFVNPRHFAIRYPTLLGMALQEIGKQQIKYGLHADALVTLGKAADRAAAVLEHPSIGADKMEAHGRRNAARNTARAQQQALAIHQLAQYLYDNDESAKAAEVLRIIPHNLLDHPLVLDLEQRSAKIRRHIESPEAYRAFYESEDATGSIPTPDAWLDPANKALPRTEWLTSWLRQTAPAARVLEIGCFDGIVAVPLLRALPQITYLGMDISPAAVDAANKNFARFGLADRAAAKHIPRGQSYAALAGAKPYDAILWCEVIEHVPDPSEDLRRLRMLLSPDGYLFITTPWGSFDAGCPPIGTERGTPRDPRGHVRVVTAQELVRRLDAERLTAIDLYKVHCDYGSALHAVARRAPESRPGRRVAFHIPGALWDWNSRTVHEHGMGASEEMIVYLAKELLGGHTTEVYGPTPQEDVHFGVRYWPRAQVRHLRDTDAKIVVSRSPCTAKALDELIGRKLPKLLWLQDAIYPDLNPEVAAEYEKIVVVSNWHKEEMHRLHGVPYEKMEVLYNFLIPKHYAQRPPRERHHFIYASSPDRGLVRLMRLWPRILEWWPDATLDIFYGWRGCQTLSDTNPDWTHRFQTCRREYDRLRFQKGVTEHGMVDHHRIAQEFMRASVWLYPTDFSETFGTVGIKARAAGAIPVTARLAGLAESAACPQAHLLDPAATDDDYIEATKLAIETPDGERMKMAVEARMKFHLGVFLPRWRALLE